jgi:dTDP-glucose pyrophosphorylase
VHAQDFGYLGVNSTIARIGVFSAKSFDAGRVCFCYGVFEFDDSFKVLSIEEKATNLISHCVVTYL